MEFKKLFLNYLGSKCLCSGSQEVTTTVFLFVCFVPIFAVLIVLQGRGIKKGAFVKMWNLCHNYNLMFQWPQQNNNNQSTPKKKKLIKLKFHNLEIRSSKLLTTHFPFENTVIISLISTWNYYLFPKFHYNSLNIIMY